MGRKRISQIQLRGISKQNEKKQDRSEIVAMLTP